MVNVWTVLKKAWPCLAIQLDGSFDFAATLYKRHVYLLLNSVGKITRYFYVSSCNDVSISGNKNINLLVHKSGIHSALNILGLVYSYFMSIGIIS